MCLPAAPQAQLPSTWQEGAELGTQRPEPPASQPLPLLGLHDVPTEAHEGRVSEAQGWPLPSRAGWAGDAALALDYLRAAGGSLRALDKASESLETKLHSLEFYCFTWKCDIMTLVPNTRPSIER